MSNKTNQSVLVNDTSSYYLKQYAALQFPDSVDNFGTKTPIHLLQQQEESEHSVSLREACDSDYDLDGAQFLFEGATYDSVTDLVKDNLCLDDEESIQEYNEHPWFDPFIPYEELVDKKNADREDIRDIRDLHSGDAADEAEYALRGAIEMFRILEEHDIHAVTVYTEPELSKAMKENARRLINGKSEICRKYIEMSWKAMTNIGIEFDTNRDIHSEYAQLALATARYLAYRDVV